MTPRDTVVEDRKNLIAGIKVAKKGRSRAVNKKGIHSLRHTFVWLAAEHGVTACGQRMRLRSNLRLSEVSFVISNHSGDANDESLEITAGLHDRPA